MFELTVELRLVEGQPPQGFTGLITRAAFLNWIRQANPALSALLHGGYDVTRRKRSVYSLKPLTALIDVSATHRFSVCFLEEAVARETLESLMRSAQGSIQMGGTLMKPESIHIRQIASEKVGSRLIGQSSLDFRFRTPTYFSVKNSSFKVIQPNITLLLTNVANTLHIAKIESIPRDKIRSIRAKLGITGLRVASQMIRDGKRVYPGFVGWVKLTAKGLEQEESRLLARLAEWAQIVNVGGGRSAGFGVVEVSPAHKKIQAGVEDREEAA